MGISAEQVEEYIVAKKLDAPRVTKESIKELIKSVQYHRLDGTTLTICVLTLNNNFTVTGESACVSLANFDPELGQKIAYEDAFNKMWQLEGYRLQCERAKE